MIESLTKYVGKKVLDNNKKLEWLKKAFDLKNMIKC